LRDLRLFEPGDQAEKAPWVRVERAEGDVSLLDLARGQTSPEHLTLHGAEVVIRFDRDGRPLTQFPKPGEGGGGELPALRVEQGKLTLRQEGKPDFVLTGINLDIRPDGGEVRLDGTVASPQWGDWKAAGSLTRATQAASLTLTSAGVVHVTQAMLEALPPVPPDTWKESQAEGGTPGELTLTYDPAAP